jgi:hypothetical protein
MRVRDIIENFNNRITEESGKEMLKIFKGVHHDSGMNKDMDRYILSHDWQLGNFTPDMFPSEEEFFDYDDPFDRVIDIDYGHRVDLSQPIIVGPQYSDGKYSVIDGNHRAAAAQRMGKTIRAYFPVKKIKEAFDTAVDWVSDLNSRNVQVFATKIDDAYIELVYISFTRGGRMSVTGEGSQNKIFGAVINHVKQWVAKNKPPRIIFSAFKPNTGPFGSQDTTRSGLYSKMVQRFAGQNGYDYDIENTGSEDTFVLTKKNVDENFADGKVKGKSRPGRVKRAGASCSGSVTALRKRAKNSGGERGKMYHWCANMKSGRAKKK